MDRVGPNRLSTSDMQRQLDLTAGVLEELGGFAST